MPNPDFTYPRKFTDPTDAANGRALEDYLRDRSFDSLKVSDLEADMILVDQTMQSNDYAEGDDGWIVHSDGSAEFNDVVVRGSLNADDIDAGTLDADRIAADSLDADKITAGTITTERIVLGSFDNLLQDPSFESGTKDFHRFQDGGGGTWAATTSSVQRSGAYALRWTANGGAGGDDSLFSNLVRTSCAPGEQFYFSIWVRPDATFNRSVQLRGRFFDNGSLVQDGGTTLSTFAGGYEQIVYRGTAPAGADTVELRIRITTSVVSVGAVDIDDITMSRMTHTLIIEDQAVDIERLLDPLYIETLTANSSNDSLSTTTNDTASVSFTIPSWVGTAHALAIVKGQISGSATHNLKARVKMASAYTSSAEETVTSGATSSVAASDVATIVAPGSTYAVAVGMVLNTGTNAVNASSISGQLTGER